jgi:hypothetical protein
MKLINFKRYEIYDYNTFTHVSQKHIFDFMYVTMYS